MDILRSITEEYKKDDIPAFGVGDTVRVHIKIKEGNRERIQVFGGIRSQETERRYQRNFYRQEDFFGSRRRKNFPASFTEDRKDRSRKKRRCQKSKTQLYA